MSDSNPVHEPDLGTRPAHGKSGLSEFGRRWVPVIVTGLLLTSCASGPVGSGGEAPATSETEASASEGVELRVLNARTQDVDIYVLSVGASRDRLGRVGAAERATLIIPVRLVEGGGIALLAQPRGYGDPFISREFVIGPADLIEWSLENNLALSTLNIRRR